MSEQPASPAERTVAFQGHPGAYSHLACAEALPDWQPLPCATFQDAFAAVTGKRAGLGMIPIENTLAGRVADIHTLLPESDLFIVGEHFQRVNHNLMVIPGGTLDDVREVHSHIHALPQCRRIIAELGLKPVVHADTAGACQMVAERGDPSIAAIGSSLAADIYGLDIVRRDVQDVPNNVTRFVLLSREHRVPPLDAAGGVMTTFIFEVRSRPAALYKALGGFATTGINMTKLESYLHGGRFEQAQFLADIEGHPESQSVRYAFEELRFFSTRVQVLGVYPRGAYRDLDDGV